MSKDKVSDIGLSGNTIVEVVAVKGDVEILKQMSYSDWLLLDRKRGFVYRAYQVGFSSYGYKK